MSEFINTIDVLGDDAVIDSIIMKTITEFKDDVVTTVGDHAFDGCNSLAEVDLPNVSLMGVNAFEGCQALSSVKMPNVSSVADSGFKNCTALVSANFPKAIYVNGSSFVGCSSLTRADFHVAKEINGNAFQNCSSLETLIVRSTAVCTLKTNVFNNTPIANGTGYIYVPMTLVDSYKAATNWSAYASQIRAIEDYPDITGG